MSKMESSNNAATAATGLSDYVESTLTAAFTGPFLAGQNVSIKHRKIGNMVMLDIAGVSSASAVGTIATATSDAIIPAASRPSASVYFPIVILNNSLKLNQIGKVEILSTGVVKVWVDPLETGLFLATGNNGWFRTTVSYAL